MADTPPTPPRSRFTSEKAAAIWFAQLNTIVLRVREGIANDKAIVLHPNEGRVLIDALYILLPEEAKRGKGNRQV